MKSASNTASSEHPLAPPEVAINDVTAGIDWARDVTPRASWNTPPSAA